MQLRVLHRNGQLRRERRQQSSLVLRHSPAPRREHAEQTDDLILREQRNSNGSLDSRLGGGVGDAGQARVRGNLPHDQHAPGAEGPERELQQPAGQLNVWTGQPDAGGRVEPIVLA